ncbi:hypothetical protein M662_06840 [Bacillus sp. SB49]|uniref:hypothetical protein n=1 Tax=Bacillus sp. SB49 TaxID=1071080 RepID=UPI000414E1A8|nr:hypothetical protein [Bacillus sp. SB49]QHT46220.1 hypothetical protein M662_06840 [Bacillus sp. SB49]
MLKGKKSKWTIFILAAALVCLSIFSMYQMLQNYSQQELHDREELLAAVMWEITNEDSGLAKEAIDEITVIKAKAGIPPFNYDVAVNKKNGEQVLYSWKDEEKSAVQRIN